MAPEKKKLYKVDPKDMAFGVLPGSHIPRLFEKKASQIKGFVELKENETPTRQSGYETVGQGELFHNSSEFTTEKAFRDLAEKSANDYERFGSKDKDMEKFLFGIKGYITAAGRSTQQKALTNLEHCMYNCCKKYSESIEAFNKKDTLTEKERQEKALAEEKLNAVMGYSNQVINKTRGSLEVPGEQKKSPTEITEPADVFLGKLGRWQKTNDALFPHEPSPNDIKQGVGLQDCFALAVLTQLADSKPDYIKNMMRDNGNGTVSVRFFHDVPKPGMTKMQSPTGSLSSLRSIKRSTSCLPVRMFTEAPLSGSR